MFSKVQAQNYTASRLFNFFNNKEENNMDSKELMIGDYFTLVDFNSPIRISAIDDDDVQLQANYQSEFDGNWYSEAHIKDLVPIPLNEKIMEDNFPADEKGYTVGWWTDEFDNAGPFWFELTANGVHIEIKYIKYVHELQHALRLCGIDKEIEL